MIDFSEIKGRVPIVDAAKFLNLQLTGEGGQFRALCPSCDSDDPRAIVVTADRNLFYCFCARKGGDQIALVAHVKKVTMRDAAEALATHFAVGRKSPPPEAQSSSDLQPLKHLDAAHDLVKALGFDPGVAEAVGLGFTGKGLMRGYVAVPVRLPSGKLIGYIGVKDAKVPPTWRF